MPTTEESPDCDGGAHEAAPEDDDRCTCVAAMRRATGVAPRPGEPWCCEECKRSGGLIGRGHRPRRATGGSPDSEPPSAGLTRRSLSCKSQLRFPASTQQARHCLAVLALSPKAALPASSVGTDAARPPRRWMMGRNKPGIPGPPPGPGPPASRQVLAPSR